MRKNGIRHIYIGIGLILAFVLWTVLVLFVDVQPIGPRDSSVGFATVNGAFHRLTGVHFTLYHITDWLGLVPIAVCLCFATLGLVQWVKRKGLFKVDRSLFVLGAFYIAVMAVYVLFELVVINRRPTLIEGYLEASYPSSTTMLVMCVMPTAILQLNARMKKGIFKKCVLSVIAVFTLFMVIGRLVSGVHWLTDIVGGLLFGTGAVAIYYGL